MDDVVLIVQGRIYDAILDELLITTAHIKNKILSTWTTEDERCIAICKEHGFDVIVQDPPEYITQANYEIKSINAACKHAINTGFKYGFRMRADTKISDMRKLLELLVERNSDKMQFLTMFQNAPHEPQYLTDHFYFGPLHLLEKYNSIYQTPGDSRFPELYLMETYFNRHNITYETIQSEVEFFQKLCYVNNITLEFTKPENRWNGNLILTYYNANTHPLFVKEKLELGI